MPSQSFMVKVEDCGITLFGRPGSILVRVLGGIKNPWSEAPLHQNSSSGREDFRISLYITPR